MTTASAPMNTTSPTLGFDLFPRPRSTKKPTVAKPAPTVAVAAKADAYLNFADMAELLEVSPPTMTRILNARGKLGLPASLVGNRWRSRRNLFVAWLEKIDREGWKIQCGEGGVRAVKADGTEVL